MAAPQDIQRTAALAAAFEAIARETPSGKFDATFPAVRAVVETFGEDGLAEALYAATPAATPWRLISEILSFATWQTSDNGTAISRTCEAWLREGVDARKALVALHLEAYPFIDKREMEQVLASVAKRFPETAGRCAELIEMRRKSPT